MIEQVVLNSFMLSGMIALMAIGFTLIFGILGIANYWHGEAYMFGAVVVYYCVVLMGVNYFAGLIAAVVAVGLLGWVSDRLIFRRFHGNLIGGIIAAIALLLMFQNGMWWIYGPLPRAIPSVITGTVTMFGATVSKERLLVFVISMMAILALSWFIKYSKPGRAMRAVQQDSEAALTQGINVKHICGLTFGIATALAALAGGLVGPIFQVTPPMGLEPLMFAFIVVILGGLGSVTGSLIASFIIGFQHSFTAAYLGPEWALAASFAFAMLILLFRPRGLMGHE